MEETEEFAAASQKKDAKVWKKKKDYREKEV